MAVPEQVEAKASADHEARREAAKNAAYSMTRPAMWVDTQLVTERGKYEFVNGKRKKVQPLSKRGFHKNVVAMIGANGRGVSWGLNREAEIIFNDARDRMREQVAAADAARKAKAEREKRDREIEAAVRAEVDADAAKLKWKRGVLQVRKHGDGIDPVVSEMDAQICNGIAVHKSVLESNPPYSVSHVASGFLVMHAATIANAKRLAARLMRITDFTQAAEAIRALSQHTYETEISPLRYNEYAVTPRSKARAEIALNKEASR